MSEFKNYYSHVSSVAEDFANQYFDEFLKDHVADGYSKRFGFNSFIGDDGKLTEYIEEIDLRDAVEILEQSNNVETDSSMWESLEPIEAVESIGFYTFRNDLEIAVKDQFSDLLEEKLDDEQGVLEKFEKQKDELKARIDKLQEEIDAFDSDDEDKLDSMESTLEKLEEKFSELEDKHSEQDDFVNSIQDAIDDM